MLNAQRVRDKLKEVVMDASDGIMALIPRGAPPPDRFKKTRVIAHRGVHTGHSDENSIEGFQKAVDLGTWGIEFDVRWTIDNEAIIHHDKDCLRTFGEDLLIENVSLENLRARCPRLPTLTEVVNRFCGRAHLMIELKRGEGIWTPARINQLGLLLTNARPIADYHLMSLDPDLLLRCEFAPPGALLPVAEFNAEVLSEIALREKMAGITGQYVLLSDKIARRHLEAGQSIGTGFIGSRSVLYREVGRGVDWIFTNHPKEMQGFIQSALHLDSPTGMRSVGL